MVPPYSLYSGLYDDLGQGQFSRAMMPLVDSILVRHGVDVHRAIDLACGTGEASILMARRGWRVLAIDGSEAMLSRAREKAAEAAVDVAFLHRSLVDLRMDEQAELAVCFYDSLNYLLEPQDLTTAFGGVARALYPGGVFVFDMNTPYCLANDWGTRIAEESAPSAGLIHIYSYDPLSGIGALELLVTERHEGEVRRFREFHRERGYAKEEVEAAMSGTGLVMREALSFPDLTPPAEDARRVIYVARKEVRR